MNQIRKDKVLTEIVRTFFKYFTMGVVETGGEITGAMCLEPANIKRAMLEHYGEIGNCFNREAFYAIARMNFEEGEAERELRDFVKAETTYMDLVKFACRDDEQYSVLVEEYKHCFEMLLCGIIGVNDSNNEDASDHENIGMVDTDLAEDILRRIAANAYAHGKGTKQG